MKELILHLLSLFITVCSVDHRHIAGKEILKNNRRIDRKVLIKYFSMDSTHDDTMGLNREKDII